MREHLRGCKKCIDETAAVEMRNYAVGFAKEAAARFVSRAEEIYRRKYDYRLVRYKDREAPVKIICPVHGVFSQLPRHHLMGKGCPRCRSSKGEQEIAAHLEKLWITFEIQKGYRSCRCKNVLRFDFWVHYRGKNYLIEYHGSQHYKKKGTGFFSDDLLAQAHGRDRVKRAWAKKCGIPLLVIPYWKRKKFPNYWRSFLGIRLGRFSTSSWSFERCVD